MGIPVNIPDISGNEARYLQECVETGWISSEGPFVERLEAAAAQQAERSHGIAVCNGTLALEIAVQALGLGPGDEVILPTFTIISCAAAIVKAGATPVVVDADPLTWNMTADAVANAITPKTKAIMVVHLYGLPVDLDPILDLAELHQLKVIEDAAEMIGQTYKGKPCGSFGDLSIMSYYPNKHVTAGEGGMILTDDDGLASRCRSLRNLCFGVEERFRHEELGTNARMSNLQAAIGVAQYERLEQSVATKRTLGARYQQGLADHPWLQLPVASADYAKNIYWIFGLVLNDRSPIDAKEAMRRLGERNIGTRPFFVGMHEQPVFRKMGLFEESHCPVSERLTRQGFYVPCGLGTSEQDVDEVIQTIQEVLK